MAGDIISISQHFERDENIVTCLIVARGNGVKLNRPICIKYVRELVSNFTTTGSVQNKKPQIIRPFRKNSNLKLVR
nr:unnamed protein product [Callosobruchus chinensis]